MSSMSWLWEVFSLGSQQLLEYVLPKETRMLKFRAAYSTENRSRNALCVSQVRLSDQLKEVLFLPFISLSVSCQIVYL